MTDLETFNAWAKDLEARQQAKRLKRKSTLWKPTATAATQLGYECVRRIVYGRMMPWAAKPISPTLASIFDEGDLHEKQATRELEEELGVRIRNRQVTFRDTKLDLVGTIDLEVWIEGIGWVPLDVKGLSFIPGEEEEGVDLQEGESDLHRRYFAQISTYLLLRRGSIEIGGLLFKSKMTGRWRIIGIKLDYEYGELLLKRAELVRDTVRAFLGAMFAAGWSENPQDKPEWSVQPTDAEGEQAAGERDRWAKALEAAEKTLPPRIADRSECPSCPYRDTVCHPSQAAVEPALLIADEQLAEQLERHVVRHPQHKEYEKLHDRLRDRFLATKGDRFLLGDLVVEKKKHGTQTHVKIFRAPGAPTPADPVVRAEAAELALRTSLEVLGDLVDRKRMPKRLVNRIAAAIVGSPISPQPKGSTP